MDQVKLRPDYVFETSWETCNKVGGINTVIATKAQTMVEQLGDKYILIGPDLWRENKENHVFLEDQELLASWREQAFDEGLQVRVGRWEIPGSPIVVLVDFTPLLSKKNDIFSDFWELYRLDSLTGGMDYIEAAIFGFAAAKVVESFYKYNLTSKDRVIAHFHEWMTGSGILYLKQNLPQVATLFTTHATTVGRSIAGHGMPLYSKLHEFNGDQKAKELGLVAKQSMEKTAANIADSFTTVSEITASECKQFLSRAVDVVTPNGFEDNFVPKGEEFETKHNVSRSMLRKIAETLLGYDLPEDVLFVGNSGRYEYQNKGIDVFVHMLGELNRSEDLNKEIVAFILVPANNYGARKDLFQRLNGDESVEIDRSGDNKYLTHGLHYSQFDAILNDLKRTGITNEQGNKVKAIFVPSYLNGKDGIFDLQYYSILIGLDLTVFPSYYEPWGYTPLESLAFHVPTITTSLAGIGRWANTEVPGSKDGIEVFDRVVGLDNELVQKIADRVIAFSHKSEYEVRRAREGAASIAQKALWKNIIRYYNLAYETALGKLDDRADSLIEIKATEHVIKPPVMKGDQPSWREVIIKSNVPEEFRGLEEISKNLWWCWNYEALDLFESIDTELWDASKHNPVVMLKEVPYEKFNQLKADPNFREQFAKVYGDFKTYMGAKDKSQKPKISYFSMEYGLSDTVKIFSGGLGILAGDYLKEASDCNVNMVAVGFMYRYGYFTQKLSLNGEQQAIYEPQNFSDIPVNLVLGEDGEPYVIKVAFPGRTICARIWRADVGRIPLYLLDTDFEMNSGDDRSISHKLYGGDNEHRLKQEMLLGIGGIRALKVLGHGDSDIYHCNEGHAALISLERIRNYIVSKNMTFYDAMEIVRSSTLFTTHTPVPAGHDAFPEDMVMMYMGHYPQRLHISWEEFISLGRMHPQDKSEPFSMSYLASHLSQEVNGVSMLHGEVTKGMFCDLWKGYFPEELHVGFVTNGVHYPTWVNKAWQKLYMRAFNDRFYHDQSNEEHWCGIYDVADEEVWGIRQDLRKRLVDHIKDRLDQNWTTRHVNPRTIVNVKNNINDKTLTIGFARRFATYKRAHLLFTDIDRLAKIVNNPHMPVQFLFAGKAHPHDTGGQELIRKIVEISNLPEFVGKVIFLQNYDIELAQKLVQGVDIWLNTPTRPLEASGTSGMKAVMNGVMNFSVLDGWWVEGYREDGGWSLPLERTYDNQDYQNELDAETIYGILENEIMPTFYKRDENGIPHEWLAMVKNCIARIAPHFTTKRMLDDYIDRFYGKLHKRIQEVRVNDYALAKELSQWKRRVLHNWHKVEVTEIKFSEDYQKPLVLGKKYAGEIIVDTKDLYDMEIGVEVVVTDKKHENGRKVECVAALDLIKKDGSKQHFGVEINPARPGTFDYAIRVYPKHEALAHRQDFAIVKWF